MLFNIIVPTFNNIDELERCIERLGNLEGIKGCKLLICVDGSTDGTEKVLKNYAFPCETMVLWHPNKENRGRSSTRNLALPFLKHPFTLFIDSDMRASRGLLEKHSLVLKEENSLSVGGIIYENTKKNIWANYISTRGVARYPSLSEIKSHHFIVPNTALPTEWILSMNGFDEKINKYGGEDMEFGYRMEQKLRPKMVFNPDASVQTEQPKELKNALKELIDYGQNGLPYILKKHSGLGSIYFLNFLREKSMKAFFFRNLLRLPIEGLIIKTASLLPEGFRNQLINYLVIKNIHKGYKKSSEDVGYV